MYPKSFVELCFYFHLIPGRFFISSLISCLTNSSFSNKLFNLHEFVYLFKIHFLYILCFIELQSDRIQGVISIVLIL